jgi:tetratricopeptide (TPR) repeat protein
MAQPGDEDERRPPDADSADTGDARSAGAEAQGLTWSEIAELDEAADGAGDPFAGTRESTGERNFGDGGLLGVDSGLLRVLDDEGPALPPDPDEDVGDPEAAPTVSGGLKLDDAAGALPGDLNLDAPPPDEDEDFDVAGFLAEAADEAVEPSPDDDRPLEADGGSPDEAGAGAAPRKSIWSFSEADFEVDEDDDEGQLDNYVDDIMTDLAVDELDAGGDWAEAVVGDVALSEAETGWGDIEVSEDALEDEEEEPPDDALFVEPDDEDDEPLDLPDDLEGEPDAVFAVTEEELDAPGPPAPIPAPVPAPAPAAAPEPSIGLDETVTSTAAWQPPAPEPEPRPEPAPLASGMHDPFAARTSDGLADEFDAVAGAEIQSEGGGGWSFDEVMPDPDIVSVAPRSRTAGLAWDVVGDGGVGSEPTLDADVRGSDFGDAAFPFEVDEAQVIDASELAVAQTVAEMPALAPPTIRGGRPPPEAVEAARALMAARSARRMEALALGREDAVVVENVLYDDGGRLVVQYESPTFDELEVDALDLVEDESLLEAEPEVEDEEVEAIVEGSGLLDVDGPGPMVIEVEADDVVDAFDAASGDDDASVLERLSREPLRLAPPGPAPQPEGGAPDVAPAADPMVVPVDVQAPAEAGAMDFGAELALDLELDGAEALAAEPTADMVRGTVDSDADGHAAYIADAVEPAIPGGLAPVDVPSEPEAAIERGQRSLVPLLAPPERSPDASYEAADFEDPGDVPQPSWHGALEEAGGQVEASAHTETFGVPFLGSVPSFDGPRGLTGFPAGSLAAVDVSPAAGPPVLPVLPRPSLGDEDPRTTALLARLLSEIEVEVDRRRLSLLLHEVGRIATGDAGDPDLALAALQAAQSVDPDFELNRWTLHRMLLDAGRVEDVVAHLARLAGRGEAGALHRAGHLARVGLRDPDRAAALWQRATEVESAPLSAHLAHYTLRLSQLDWEQAERALEPAIEAARGATLRGVLELDRIRLTEELGGNPDTLHTRYEAALEHLGGSAAMLAAVERHVVERGGFELLLQALRARFDTVMADFNDGHLKEDEAKREVAEVFFKAAWALEKLGRRSEALREYQNALRTWPGDPYLLHRAAELAWSLGMPDEHRAILERMAQDAGAPADAANAMYQRGLIAQSVLGDDREAARDFERALGMMPTFTPALAALGRLSIRQGRWDEVHARYAAEIAQLEESLGNTSDADARQRTIRGLVSRYYRVARLLELRM